MAVRKVQIVTAISFNGLMVQMVLVEVAEVVTEVVVAEVVMEVAAEVVTEEAVEVVTEVVAIAEETRTTGVDRLVAAGERKHEEQEPVLLLQKDLEEQPLVGVPRGSVEFAELKVLFKLTC